MFNQHRGTLAPLPADGVAAAHAPFGSSRMLPRLAYVDPAVYDWEQANIFSGWMCLGRGEKFAEAGAQTSVETGAGGVLLVRGEDGVLRAFANVCRHRGHELVPCGVSVQKKLDRLPVPRVDLQARRLAAQRPRRLPRRRGLRQVAVRPGRAERRGVARLGVRRPER